MTLLKRISKSTDKAVLAFYIDSLDRTNTIGSDFENVDLDALKERIKGLLKNKNRLKTLKALLSGRKEHRTVQTENEVFELEMSGYSLTGYNRISKSDYQLEK